MYNKKTLSPAQQYEISRTTTSYGNGEDKRAAKRLQTIGKKYKKTIKLKRCVFDKLLVKDGKIITFDTVPNKASSPINEIKMYIPYDADPAYMLPINIVIPKKRKKRVKIKISYPRLVNNYSNFTEYQKYENLEFVWGILSHCKQVVCGLNDFSREMLQIDFDTDKHGNKDLTRFLHHLDPLYFIHFCEEYNIPIPKFLDINLKKGGFHLIIPHKPIIYIPDEWAGKINAYFWMERQNDLYKKVYFNFCTIFELLTIYKGDPNWTYKTTRNPYWSMDQKDYKVHILTNKYDGGYDDYYSLEELFDLTEQAIKNIMADQGITELEKVPTAKTSRNQSKPRANTSNMKYKRGESRYMDMFYYFLRAFQGEFYNKGLSFEEAKEQALQNKTVQDIIKYFKSDKTRIKYGKDHFLSEDQINKNFENALKTELSGKNKVGRGHSPLQRQWGRENQITKMNHRIFLINKYFYDDFVSKRITAKYIAEENKISLSACYKYLSKIKKQRKEEDSFFMFNDSMGFEVRQKVKNEFGSITRICPVKDMANTSHSHLFIDNSLLENIKSIIKNIDNESQSYIYYYSIQDRIDSDTAQTSEKNYCSNTT